MQIIILKFKLMKNINFKSKIKQKIEFENYKTMQGIKWIVKIKISHTVKMN